MRMVVTLRGGYAVALLLQVCSENASSNREVEDNLFVELMCVQVLARVLGLQAGARSRRNPMLVVVTKKREQVYTGICACSMPKRENHARASKARKVPKPGMKEEWMPVRTP